MSSRWEENMSIQIKKAAVCLWVVLAVALLLCPTAFAATTGTIRKDNVNLRAKPNTDAEIVSVLSKGAEVTISDTEGDWYKVTSGGQKGYVRSDMVEKAKKMYVSKDKVNLRKDASEDAGVITRLSLGQAVDKLGTAGEWVKVKADGQKGYVRSDMLSSSKPEANASDSGGAAATADTTETTTTDSVAIKELQQSLKSLGFYYGGVDGKEGTVTLAALKAFQRAYGLNIDGKPGAETLQTMQTALDSGGNGSNAGSVKVSSNGVILSEWFNYMKYSIPKYESLLCVDVATGEQFHLRPFSLGNHADVEPPTKEDTNKLYAINGNQWTWTPRAIWVYIDGKAYAAAINVKPHGPDTLPDNGMSGQICMHFLHSRQHNTGQENRNLQEAVLLAFSKAENAPAPESLEAAATVVDPVNTVEFDDLELLDEEGEDALS